jgi:Type IV secretion system pilin
MNLRSSRHVDVATPRPAAPDDLDHPPEGNAAPASAATNRKAVMDLNSAITQLFDKLLALGTGVGGAIAAVFFMWGAYQLMVAGGSPRQMESGKQAMWHALAGLALVLAANAVATWIGKSLAGVGG